MAEGRADEAESIVREGVAVDPGDADSHNLLGAILSSRHALVEGAWHLLEALRIAGRPSHLLINLGRNLARQGRLEEAEALAAEALAKEPLSAAACILQSVIEEQRGSLDAAERAFADARSRASEHGDPIGFGQALIRLRGPQWQDALASLDRETELPGAVQLARGRARERAGRYPDAWTDFVAAKALLAAEAGRRYDRGSIEAHFEAVAGAFSAPFWKTLPPAATRTDVPQPIFILGFPRSGTTMTEQVLASHSAIRAGGELSFGFELRDFVQHLLGDGQPFPAGLWKLAAADHHHLPALFRDFYLARAAQHGLLVPSVRFFTDKMPLIEAYLPLLRLAFPESPLISTTRHPLDVVVSVMSHDLTHGANCGYRLADAAHQMAALGQVARHYRDTLGIARHTLVYERFVNAPEAETRCLMDHVGLATEPSQLAFHRSSRHAPTPSYAQVKEPPHTRSIGRWRHYARELEPVLPLLRDVMVDGGYHS